MIWVLPSSICPKKYTGYKRKFFLDFWSSILIIIWGIIATYLIKDLSCGVLPKSLTKIIYFIRGGNHICPLCGGLRSFVYSCKGDFLTAVSYNLLGVILFFLVIIQIPLKGYFLYLTDKRVNSRIEKFFDLFYSNTFLLYLIFISFSIQLVFSYFGIIEWIPWKNYTSSAMIN